MAKFNIETSDLIDKYKITKECVIPIKVIRDGVRSKVYLDWVNMTENMLYKTKKGNYFEYVVQTWEPVQKNYKHLKEEKVFKFRCNPEVFFEFKRQLSSTSGFSH